MGKRSEACIIFDMDGTLWDSTENVTNAYNEMLEQQRGWKNFLTTRDIAAIMGMEIEEIADALFQRVIADPKERLQLTLDCMGHENDYLAKHGGLLYPAVEATLRQLAKRHSLMIVTNAADGYVDAMFAAHGLRSYFRDWETYGRTGRPKGENIQAIMKRNKITDACYVGDTQKDCDACALAGIPFIFASYGFGDVTQYADRIDSFAALLDLFD